MTDPNTLADEIVSRCDTDEMALLPLADVDALRAAFWYPDYYEFADVVSNGPSFESGLFSLLRECRETQGTDKHADACIGLVGVLMMHAGAMSDSLAEQALRDAYDRAHPDNSTEQDDWRQRARDLRATA